MNSIWLITFVNHLHVWVTKFKSSLIFFKLSILTSNNIIWVGLFAVLFDEARHVVETSTTGYVPVCYGVINLFIKPRNVLLMLLIFKLKGLYLIVTVGNCCIFFFHDSRQNCFRGPLHKGFGPGHFTPQKETIKTRFFQQISSSCGTSGQTCLLSTISLTSSILVIYF